MRAQRGESVCCRLSWRSARRAPATVQSIVAGPHVNAALVNFLNHGHLPFVAREPELERIIAFWRGSADAQGLRAMLLVGEAGAGKSRLVEEAGSLIARARGLVVHTKLYPESATSLVPLIARGIVRAAGATRLVRSEPDGTLPAVAAALRRLARLRRVILIIEDVHLLTRESLKELSILLDNVADDGLALLCSARNETIAAQSVLERHVVEEMRLGGFDRTGLDALLANLFEGPVDGSIAATLLPATRGNVLAIRSALRSAIRAGTIEHRGGAWAPTVPMPALEAGFAESVRMLSEGMAIHLEDDERAVAAAIAPLGEVFARESAARLVDEAMIDGLVFKGIFTRAMTGATILPGGAAEGPVLAFSHTLVHRYFLDAARGSLAPMIAAIADGAPLYSTEAFNSVARGTSLGDVDAVTLARAASRAHTIAMWLNPSPDWELAMGVLDAAERLFTAAAPSLDRSQRLELETETLSCRLSVLGRLHGPEFERVLERLLALTADPRDHVERLCRMRALGQQQYWAQRKKPEMWGEIDDEAKALVAVDPALAAAPPFHNYLRSAMSCARSRGDLTGLRDVERRFETILADESIPPDVRQRAKRSFGSLVIDIFESEEELGRRMALFEELGGYADVDRAAIGLHHSIALYESGQIEAAWEGIDEIMPTYRDRGWRRTVTQCQIMRLCIRLLRGEDADAAERDVIALAAAAPREFEMMISTSIATHVVSAAEHAGREEHARRLHVRFGATVATHNALVETAMRLVDGVPDALDNADLADYFEQSDEVLTRRAGVDRATLLAAFAAELARRPYRLDSSATVRLLVQLAREHDRRDPLLGLAPALESAMHDAIVACVEWLLARRLRHLAGVFLARHADLLTSRERTRFDAAIAAMAPSAGAVEAAGDDRIRISMLGTISVTRPGAEAIRPKGARLRALLGVLSADAMLERHLSNQEFYRLAAEEHDIDRARRAVYVAVHRLREILGAGAIVTDGETPRFDRRIVAVDVVEASALLRDAHDASLDGDLLRSSTSLLATLDITRGDVPFPGLYDDYFEAAREDFDGLLRATIVRVARGLLVEEDAETAEEVLRRALTAMPEDEDLSELLCEALIALGRRAEAERVRREREAIED
jgi:DNA-binding SARP family transcriptional activator